VVEVEDRAFADVDEEADVLLASAERLLARENGEGWGLSD
jgi:hypothetical protein